MITSISEPYFICIDASNANDIWEADVYGSLDGLNPSTDKYHLILGDNLPPILDPKLAQVGPMITIVGYTIEDQMKSDEDGIADHAIGARELIRSSPDNTEFVVRIDAGGISRLDAISRLTYGNDISYEREKSLEMSAA